MAYLNEKLTAAQAFVTTPATDVSTSGSINDLANSTTSYIRLTAATTLTSIVADDGGKVLTLVNANSVACTIKNEDGTQTAANRIVTGTGGDFSLPASSQIVLQYDLGASRWRVTVAPSAAIVLDQSLDVENLSITTSVAANALTIAFKTKAGSDASAGSPVRVAFRNATNATGDYSVVSLTGALSTVVSSGSTLGQLSATREPIYIYALNNAGSMEIAYSTTLFDCTVRQSTTAEGGAGAADDRYTLYSTTARTNVAIRLVGKLVSSQTTAGTWATAIAETKVLPLFDIPSVVPSSKNTYSVTYSAAFGTTSGAEMIWYRVADRMIANLTVKCGTVAASAASITLPTGITINTAQQFTSAGKNVVGRADRIRTGGTPASPQLIEAFYDGSDNTKIFFAFQSASNALSKSNGGDWFSNNDDVWIQFDIPVTAWAL